MSGHARAVVLAGGLALAAWVGGLALPAGLRGQYFFGSELTGQPAQTAIDSGFSALEMSRRWRFAPPDAFSAQWSGYMFVARQGLYQFAVTADDGARLYVDRQLVVDRGPGPGTRSGQVQLDRGPHAVLLQYFQLGGPYFLDWQWARDGGPLSPVPPWALSTTARRYSTVFVVRTLSWLLWMSAIAAIVLAGRTAFRLGREPSSPGRDRSRFPGGDIGIRHGVACLALFVGLAMLQTWPLISNPAHLSRNDNADAVLNEWTMRWVVHQAWNDPMHLFDANIFYPERRTLAYSEPLIVQSALGAPLAAAGASPVLVYNLVLLAGFALSGWAMSLVVARWTGDWIAGIASGILFAFNAHTLTRLPHIQAQHAEFLPLALFSLDAFLRRPRWASALWLALWFTLQALSSIYLLVFTAIVLTIAVIVRPEDWLSQSFSALAPKLAAAAGLAAVAILPFVLPYWRLHEAGLVRSLDEVAFFSAEGRDYLTTPSRLYWWIGASARGGNALFPGMTALLLAGVALVAGGTAFRDRRARMCLAFGLCGALLSFGPIVPGYSFLYSIVPLFQAIRASARFGYLALVAVAVLGGYGLAEVRRRCNGRRSLKNAVSIGVLVLVFAEPFAAPIGYQPFTEIPPIYQRLQSAENAVVVDLPFPAPDATYRNVPYMLGSTLHFKPMLNGYSGFTPPSYFAHHEQLVRFPDAASIAALQAAGVTHVFVHSDRLDAEGSQAIARFTALHQIDTNGSIALYQLEAGR